MNSDGTSIFRKFGIVKSASLIGTIIIIIVLLIVSGNIIENLNADQIMVIQRVGTGKLVWHVRPGWKTQFFGRVTKYWKLDTYEFQIPVRFNDGGHGTIHGSVNYELPLEVENLNSLHMKYGSQASIQKDLIEVVVNKCVYMTGPLMSSKESYAEKRTNLIRYIEDQIKNGVYATSQKDIILQLLKMQLKQLEQYIKIKRLDHLVIVDVFHFSLQKI